MNASPLSGTDISQLRLLHRGKVRDVYEVDERRLLLVATDRISAFDCVLPTRIPHKGAVLTQLSAFWFEHLRDIVPHHLISLDLDELAPALQKAPDLAGRASLVHRTTVFPVECVVRGYLEGSGWKDYLATGGISGNRLPAGMQQCERLPEPIFTPATKAVSGHDENIGFERFASIIGERDAEHLREISLRLYNEASAYAESKGLIIADTKFEFGRDVGDRILLIDEVLTPDSSRFWARDEYSPGRAQRSFDKQFVREYLETLDWDKTPPAPALPPDVVEATTERYLEAYRTLTGTAMQV